MSSKANPAIIGLFVVLAIAVALAAVVVLGSGQFFHKTTQAVLYFKGSVAGLDEGAPVEFSGVRLGSVTDVRMVYDATQDAVRIPVFIELDGGLIAGLPMSPSVPSGERLRRGVASGLRGRLETQSLITGKLKVVLTHEPDAPAETPPDEDGRIVIPTVTGTLDEWAQRIESLPLQQIAFSLQETLRNLSDLIAAPELRASVSNLNETTRSAALLTEDLRQANLPELSVQMRELVMQLRASLPPAEIEKTFTNLNTTLIQSQVALSEVTASVGPLREESLRAMREIGEAARSIRLLGDYLERHPEALLRGKREDGE